MDSSRTTPPQGKIKTWHKFCAKSCRGPNGTFLEKSCRVEGKAPHVQHEAGRTAPHVQHEAGTKHRTCSMKRGEQHRTCSMKRGEQHRTRSIPRLHSSCLIGKLQTIQPRVPTMLSWSQISMHPPRFSISIFQWKSALNGICILLGSPRPDKKNTKYRGSRMETKCISSYRKSHSI